MDDFLQAVTSDFGSIATSTGFRFNQFSGSVDWENLGWIKLIQNLIIQYFFHYINNNY